jgi:cell division septal protein FtsQ
VVRKRELTIGVSILLIATFAFVLGWTNLFTVKKFEIIGAPNKEVLNLVNKYSDIQIGEQMARVEPRAVATRISDSGIDWLESVDISRNWLRGQITIKLKARNAVAKFGEKYVDISGTLFASPVEIKGFLPELLANDNQSRANGLALYLDLPEDFKNLVTRISASSQNNFQFEIDPLTGKTSGEKLKVIWGAPKDSEIKVEIYQKLVALKENKGIKLIDLSDPTKPSVR